MSNVSKRKGIAEHNVSVSSKNKHDELHEQCRVALDLAQTAPKKAYELAEQILEQTKGQEYAKCHIIATRLKAICLNRMGKNDEALRQINKAQSLYQKYGLKDKKVICNIFNDKGITYMEKGNFQLAIDALLGAVQLVDNEITAVSVYGNLGNAYFKIERKSKALKYWSEGLKYAEKHRQISSFFIIKNNIASCHLSMNEIEIAKKETLAILENIEHHTDDYQLYTRTKAPTLLNLGEICRKEKNFEQALEALKQVLPLAEEMSNPLYYCKAHRLIGGVYFDMDDEENALHHIHKALGYADEAKLQGQKEETLKEPVHFYKRTHQPAKAFPFHKMLYELSEEQLAKSKNENLQKIITKREAEIHLLEEKNHEIQEQNAILKQFTYIISHDLREPIRGITSFASMLNRKYAESLDQTANEYLRFILSEANSMNRNLARLLKYTTIERNTEKTKEVDIQEIIHQIEYQYQNQPLELNISYQGTSLKMQPEHAELLLTELIGNAIQFKKENEACKIEIKNDLKEGYYQLSVKDYGIGIDPIYHNKIFKIFNKINKHAGAGVGLAICQRIVQLYKGQITVESVSNQFCAFYMEIAV